MNNTEVIYTKYRMRVISGGVSTIGDYFHEKSIEEFTGL